MSLMILVAWCSSSVIGPRYDVDGRVDEDDDKIDVVAVGGVVVEAVVAREVVKVVGLGSVDREDVVVRRGRFSMGTRLYRRDESY